MNIICNSLLLIVINLIILREYSVIQNYHYEFSKYLHHIKNNYKKYGYFLYCLLGVFVLRFQLLFMAMIVLLIMYLLKDYKMKYTKRIKRLFVIDFILLTILVITNTLKYVFTVPFLYLYLLHCLSLLVEKIVFLKFLKKAKSKIENKYVIGVTGSCGKTSIKNIVYDLLINDFNVSKTPKSYNTRVGIVKSINDNVSVYDDYFVCEYGVDKVGGMDKLLKVVKPNIAIISEIGNQHLLTFKTQKNILMEKMKLIDAIKDKGIGIINNDNALLRNYDYGNKTILRYGIVNQSDVMGKNIALTSDYSEFDLYIKDKFIKRVKINLLSYHSVENVLCGVCVCLGLGIEIKDILKNIKNITCVEHRLEKKIIEGIEVIDDAFNSNIKGFKDAIDILNSDKRYKIVITPGIIEQGKNNANISYKISEYMIHKCDFICLVSNNSKYIEEYFKENKFTDFKCFTSFIEAWDYVKKIDEEKIVLIENDLPSIYLK